LPEEREARKETERGLGSYAGNIDKVWALSQRFKIF